MKFQFKVIETQTVEMLYTVEAGTLQKARAKAAIGETVKEVEIDGRCEVLNRIIVGRVQ